MASLPIRWDSRSHLVGLRDGASRADAVRIDLQMASVRLGTFNQNELLEYIQSLGPDAELLTANASRDVLDAMTCFVERCTGEQNSDRRPLLKCRDAPVDDRRSQHSHDMPWQTFFGVDLQAPTSMPTWRPPRSTMCKSLPHSCFGP